jgi:hypothetical protein
MDNENILEDFCNRIAAEIRLPEAIKKIIKSISIFLVLLIV